MALRVGLAGCGVHGERYARHLLAGDVAGARLTALSRRDADRGKAFAADHSVHFVADPHELSVHSDVDVVVLVLPPSLHGPLASACIANDRPVLVEKPMAADVATAGTLREEVRDSGALLMVAHTLRFDPLVAAMKETIGSLGRITAVSINQRFEPSDRSWLDRPGDGGLILNTGVHGFDLLRYFIGREPKAITAMAGRARTTNTEDQFAAIVDFGGGQTLGVVDNARSTESRSGRIELVGEAGQTWGDHIHRTFRTVRGREVSTLRTIPASPTIPLTLAAFVDCVERQAEPPIDVEDGLAAVRMVDAARHSASTGRQVALD